MKAIQEYLEKHWSTLFLRVTIIGLGLLVLVFCAIPVVAIAGDWANEFPALASLRYGIIINLYLSAILFYIVLYQTWKLLRYIDRNSAFSDASVEALRVIKRCAIGISVLFFAWLPLVFYIAQLDDAPGLVIIGMMLVSVPVVVAVLAAVLQKVLRNAIDIKRENELTV